MIFSKNIDIDSNYPNSSIYWIYHEELHTDPSVSGYVGVCVKGTDHRFNRHLGDAKNGSNLLVHRAIRKYGDKIKVKTLLLANPEICLLLEEMLRPISQIEGTWNICAGGSKNMLGYIPSDETRAKISKANKGRVVSEEQKDKQSKTNTGKKATEETKLKMSIAKKGKPLNLSVEERQRRKDNHSQLHTVEAIEKMRQKLLGRPLTTEHKEAISRTSSGVPKTIEHANKISKALIGKKKSEDHVRNMSEVQLKLHKNISPWENYRANQDAWSKAMDIVDFLQSGNRCSDGKLAKLFNIPKRSYIVTIKNNFINGWLPEKDYKYLEWLASYKLKQEAQNGPPTI